MANRAYLYASDRADDWTLPDTDYYDSRWTIPLAWFFFFQPGDVRLIDVRSDGSDWQEVKFSAEKQQGLDLFAAREPLLRLLVEDHTTRKKIAQFLEIIERRPGQFLLMDPGEVLGGMPYDDEVAAQMFAEILELLGSGDAPPEAVRLAMEPFVGDLGADPERRECRVIGYTYSTM